MAISNTESARRYRERNRDRVLQMAKDWRTKNKERVAGYSKAYHLRRKGFSADSYALALSLQGQACAICGTPFAQMEPKAVHADHNHQTGTPRGVLCHYCNVGLGVFKDSPDLLQAAVMYLLKPTIEEINMLEPTVEELKVAVAENTAAIRDLIAALANGLPVAPALEAAPQKAEPKVKKQEVSAATQEQKAEPVAAQDEAAPSVVTYDECAGAVTKLAKAKGRPAAVTLLSEFGLKTLQDAKADPALLAQIKAAADKAQGE